VPLAVKSIVLRARKAKPPGAFATSSKLPVLFPSRNCPDTRPFTSVKPQASVGSVMMATPGSSKAKQIS
jgi:hypothetical protein